MMMISRATKALVLAAALTFGTVGLAAALPMAIGGSADVNIAAAATGADGLVQLAHGFHCQKLWGSTNRGMRLHNHAAACRRHQEPDFDLQLHVLPHIFFNMENHEHRPMRRLHR